MPSKTRCDLLLLIVDGAFQTKVWHRADDQGQHRQAAYRAGPLLKGWNCLRVDVRAEWKAATRAARKRLADLLGKLQVRTTGHAAMLARRARPCQVQASAEWQIVDHEPRMRYHAREIWTSNAISFR